MHKEYLRESTGIFIQPQALAVFNHAISEHISTARAAAISAAAHPGLCKNGLAKNQREQILFQGGERGFCCSGFPRGAMRADGCFAPTLRGKCARHRRR